MEKRLILSQRLRFKMDDWLIEVYPDFEDLIESASDLRIIKAIEKYYEGGVYRFIIEELEIEELEKKDI